MGLQWRKQSMISEKIWEGIAGYLCDTIDVSFHRQQYEKLRKLKKKKNRNEQSSYKTGSFEEVSDGVDYESCEKKMSTRILKKNHLYLKRKYNLLKTKHPKVRFLQEPQPSSMILLNELIRAESRNVVTNDIDYACAELDGNELSLYEIQMPKSKHSRW